MSETLLTLETPFSTQTTENPLARLVYGFASVAEIIDSDGERVEPTEFELDVFKNSPVILLNHQFIKEDNGVDSAAGKVVGATASYIKSENPENPEEWLVHSIKTDEFVASYRKEKVPRLGMGSRGLFVIGEIFHPIAVKKIDMGEVGAFSWRGLASFTTSPDGIRNLKSIRLDEITVTQIGANNHSNFMVIDKEDSRYNKEISIKSCIPYKLKFSKENYDEGTLKEYIKKYHPNKQISQTQDDYFVQLAETSDVVSDAAFNFTQNLIAAPMKMNTKNIVTKFTDPKEDIMSQDLEVTSTEPRQSVAVKYYMVNKDLLDLCLPSLQVKENVKTFTLVEDDVDMEASVDLIHIPQEVVDAAIESAVGVEAAPVEVVETLETPEAVIETVVLETPEVEVQNAQAEEISELKQGLMAAMAGIQTLLENQNKEAAEKTATLEAVKKSQIEIAKEKAAESQAQYAEMIKSLSNSAIPAQPVREEKIESTKSYSQTIAKQVSGDAAVAFMFNRDVNMEGAY